VKTVFLEDAIYKIGVLERFPELVHGISTRLAPGGGDWNLSAKRGTPEHPPSAHAALANRRKLASRLGIPLASMVGCQQVHGNSVAVVGSEDAGSGMLPGVPALSGCDAMVTSTPGIYLLVLSADCPPVFFYDPVRHAVGLAHSGWKGTVGRVSANVVRAMHANFGCEPANIVAAVGPGIGGCCYSVRDDVVRAVEQAFPDAWRPVGQSSPLLGRRDSVVWFDIPQAIYRTLLDAGISAANISVEGVCTAHNLHVFYSHRGEAGQCGLFGAVIGMRPHSPTHE
jgi:YfiH family protein